MDAALPPLLPVSVERNPPYGRRPCKVAGGRMPGHHFRSVLSWPPNKAVLTELQQESRMSRALLAFVRRLMD